MLYKIVTLNFYRQIGCNVNGVENVARCKGVNRIHSKGQNTGEASDGSAYNRTEEQDLGSKPGNTNAGLGSDVL